MRRIFMKYRVKNYKVSDALRPNPMLGKRHFHIDIEDDSLSEAELKDAAEKTAPDGHELYNFDITTINQKTMFSKSIEDLTKTLGI